MTNSTRNKIISFSISFMVIAAGIIVFIPFLYMFSSSMRTPAEAFKLPPAIVPERFMIENYISLFQSDLPFAKMFLNSSIVTIVTIGVQIVICSMAAYAFSKIDFVGKNFWFLAFLMSMMVPVQATIIPVYIIMSKIHLINKLSSVILISVFNALESFSCVSLLPQCQMLLSRRQKSTGQDILGFVGRLRFRW